MGMEIGASARDVATVPAADVEATLRGMTASEFSAALRTLMGAPEYMEGVMAALGQEQVLAACRCLPGADVQEMGHITDRELLLDCEHSTAASLLNRNISDATRDAARTHFNGAY